LESYARTADYPRPVSSALRACLAQLDAMVEVEKKARAVISAADQRADRARAMQRAAGEAGRGGPSGADAIRAVESAHPIVTDISNAVADLRDAFAAYDATKGGE